MTEAADSSQLHVQMRGVSKSFGGITVLAPINLAIKRGTVHALVGENGAGKSTLSKIIAGVYESDSGQLIVNGESVQFHNPREAISRGIATIAQELALVPGLTVAENVFLGSEPRRAGFLKNKELKARVKEILTDVGFELDPDAKVGSLRTADQQKVEILRALASGASFIIMDEPTAALSGADTQRLHDLIKQLRDSGRTVLLISHFLSEVLSLADNVTILRDGQLVRTAEATQENEKTLITGMLGRDLNSVYPELPPVPSQDLAPVMEVKEIEAAGVHNVSFSLRPGEIVGLAGLVGAGRSEIVQAIAGGRKRTSGQVLVHSSALEKGTVSEALRAGIFLIPESRKDQGLFLQQSIRRNISISNLNLFSKLGWVNRKKEADESHEKLMEVTVQGSDTRPVSALSGGNQQKVLFGRALIQKRNVIIADEPTRGVDIGSRRAIYDLIVEQAKQGIGVIIVSSDLDEVIGLSHRVLVVRGGRIVADLSGENRTEEAILAAAFTESVKN
jgi:simple sugar transport system ATP-binding protein/ribose transport system ATP-binding protein